MWFRGEVRPLTVDDSKDGKESKEAIHGQVDSLEKLAGGEKVQEGVRASVEETRRNPVGKDVEEPADGLERDGNSFGSLGIVSSRKRLREPSDYEICEGEEREKG